MPAARPRKPRAKPAPTNGAQIGTIPGVPYEIQMFNITEQMRLLRDLPSFNQVMLLIQQVVIASLKQLEDNDDPTRDSYYKLKWVSFKTVYETINYYIDGIVSARRDAVRELLENLGYDEAFIERHQDISFAPLMPGAQLTSYPTAPAFTPPGGEPNY